MATRGSDSDETSRKALDALLRGLPATRLLDYGVARTDILALHEPVSSVEDWVERALSLGEARGSFARTALTQAETTMAAQEFEWRAAILNVAQIAFNADTPDKERIYRAALESWEQAGQLTGEFQGLSYQLSGTDVRAWALPVEQAKGCVLLWGGLSGWGLSYLGLARALARRGVSALMVELPGQGMSRMESGLFLDADGLDSLSPLIELARAFGPKVGVMGNSFGGLIAARFAAHFQSDITACCVNGAPPHMLLPDFRTPREQMLAASGLAEVDLEDWLDRLAFRPDHHKLHCPVLIVEGGNDPLVPLGAQAPFVSDPASSKTLTWAAGEHTIYNFANDRNALVSAWFADTLKNS